MIIRKLSVYTMMCLSVISFSTYAASVDTQSEMPRSGFFAGLGGSYNSVYPNQAINGSLVANYYADGALATIAENTLPSFSTPPIMTTFAPVVQIGYFKQFADSHWFWGAKLLYQYLNLKSSNKFSDSNSFFSGVGFPGAPTQPIALLSQNASIEINHEFIFMPLMGYSFKNNQIYFGIGPALFESKSTLSQSMEYLTFAATLQDDIVFNKASNKNWMWGGAFQVGVTHYFNPEWFVDLNYLYGATKTYDYNDRPAFASAVTQAGVTLSNSTAYKVHTSQYITTQSFMLTVNKVFM